jgi:hypothetical protein
MHQSVISYDMNLFVHLAKYDDNCKLCLGRIYCLLLTSVVESIGGLRGGNLPGEAVIYPVTNISNSSLLISPTNKQAWLLRHTLHTK